MCEIIWANAFQALTIQFHSMISLHFQFSSLFQILHDSCYKTGSECFSSLTKSRKTLLKQTVPY